MIPAGILTALPAEARTLSGGAIPNNTATVCGSHLLIVSGVGPERAAAAARKLLNSGARALISWGCAGGLAAHLRSGTLLLPRAVTGSNQQRYAVDNVWRTRLHDRLQPHVTVDTGALVSSDAVIDTAAAKSALHARSAAAAVDMESAAIAAMAQTAGVPFLVIRAIADPQSLVIPAFIPRITDPYGRVETLALIGGLLREPSALPRLLALRHGWNAALRTLRTVARASGADFAAQG